MATWASGLDHSVARVFGDNAPYGALATLVRPDQAITPASVVERVPLEEVLTLGFLDASVKATVAHTSTEHGLAVLQLHDVPPGLRSLPVANSDADAAVRSEWVTFVITKEDEAGTAGGDVTGFGALSGVRHLTLRATVREDLLTQGSAGAPVVVDGELVGLLVGASGETWYAVPVADFGRLYLGPAPYETPLARLTVAAERVLAWAEGIRVARGHDVVDPDSLLGALLTEEDGPVARAFVASGIDWASIPQLPDRDRVRPVALTGMPAMSPDADQAVATAYRRADTRRNTQVQTTDLLAGLLPVSAVLRAHGLAVEAGTPAVEPIADYRSDAVAGPDALGIAKDVRILASVLVAKAVDPPLALGLFGEWGSGKSFFMRELAAYIEVLRQDARNAGGASAFCENVVQLRFNAWNYIDTDLWASLTSEIFEGLAQELDREAHGVDHPRQRLLAAAASTRDVLAEAQRAKDLAEDDLRVSEERLARLREEAGRSPKTIARAAYRVAVEQPEVRQKVQDAARQLGLAPDRDVAAHLLELGGQRAGFLRAMVEAVRQRRLALTVLAVAAVIVVAAVVAGQALAGLLAAVAGAAVALGPLVPLITRTLGLARDAHAAADKEIGRATQDLQNRRDQAAAKLGEADQQVAHAAHLVESLSRELDELRADRQMSDFVRKRTLSQDYTSHLGVISRARNDFEELSRLLTAVRDEDVEPGPRLPKIDRIVLYIDDLDRCPESKVVDVIQAVHLLLAFPLFVVVVGVDARWLLHSLKQFSPAFQEADDEDGPAGLRGLNAFTGAEDGHWRSTPLNYLEKIFQIPFTLRPMTPGGYAALIDSVAGNATAESPPPAQESSPVAPEPTTAASEPAAELPEPEPEPEPVAAPPTAPPPISPPPVVERDPGFLRLEDFELDCIKRLYPLVPSPRAAKRLVNVYRLIRAGIDESAREEFVGDESRGSHRAVLLLLAVVSSYPVEGGELLRELIMNEQPGTWWRFVESFMPPTERGQEVRDKLDEVRPLIREDEPCSTFVSWAPEVARFSFTSGRVFAPPPQRIGVSDSSTNSESST